jgi:hypothetical protein
MGRWHSLALAASLLLLQQLHHRSKNHRRQSRAPGAEKTRKTLKGNDPASPLNVLTNGLIAAASVFDITHKDDERPPSPLN